MSSALPRRRVITAALAAAAAGTLPVSSVATTELRGDDSARLPDHAALWSHLPLPFSPAQAWQLLSPATQTEIGAAVIGMALAQYIHGDSRDDADQFDDGALRNEACDVADDILNRMDDRLWVLFPDLYGPDGDHPAWALNGGLAR